jgi:hypothetical protein
MKNFEKNLGYRKLQKILAMKDRGEFLVVKNFWKTGYIKSSGKLIVKNFRGEKTTLFIFAFPS